MNAYKYPLAVSTWDDAEHAAMQRVMDSGMFTMGPNVAEFERQFADYLGVRHAVMVNSGSSANLLMVNALLYASQNPIKRGDEVIVPAVAWSTTYFPLHQCGLKLRFVDIDLETLNYDLDQLEAALSDNTKLVMVVNLLGNPNDFNAIKRILSERDIPFIEDNCESMGAEFESQKAGTFGLMGTFSTFFSHHISTMEGGFVVTNEEELYHILLAIRAHGWTRDLPKFNRVSGEKSDDAFKESFNFVLPGFNVRPLELSGAIGLRQLEKLSDLLAQRRNNAAEVISAFARSQNIMVQREIGKSSWFGFSLILRKGSSITRADLFEMLISSGFECRPIVSGNFAKNDVLKYFDYSIFGSLDNANWIDENGLFIGNNHYSIKEGVHSLAKLVG